MNGTGYPIRRPRSVGALTTAWGVAMSLLVGLPPPAMAGDGMLPAPLAAAPAVAAADTGVAISAAARQLADWVAATGDHGGAPFLIVDKRRATVLVFDTGARLRAQSVVLLGAALGDESVPGIGTRPMSQILPTERTTPAGRFAAERGRNIQGEDIVWIDYDAAVSMHRVRLSNAKEQRAQRLATPTIDDNRISYGCINVPAAFYDQFIQPIFAVGKAIVYVLPDLKPAQEVFGIPQAVTTDVVSRRPLR